MSVRAFTYIRIKQSQPQWPRNLTRIKKKARANFFLIFVSRRRLKEGENQSNQTFFSLRLEFGNFPKLLSSRLQYSWIQWCYAMPGQVMPCHPKSCQVMPRQAGHSIPCHAKPLHAKPATLYHGTLCHSIWCHAMFFYAMPHYAIQYYATTCRLLYIMARHADYSIPWHAMQPTLCHATPCRLIYTFSCVDARATWKL